MTAEALVSPNASTRSGELATRRDTVAESARADMQTLIDDALRAISELEAIGRTFPQLAYRRDCLNVACANLSWVRDNLDGHG